MRAFYTNKDGEQVISEYDLSMQDLEKNWSNGHTFDVPNKPGMCSKDWYLKDVADLRVRFPQFNFRYIVYRNVVRRAPRSITAEPLIPNGSGGILDLYHGEEYDSVTQMERTLFSNDSYVGESVSASMFGFLPLEIGKFPKIIESLKSRSRGDNQESRDQTNSYFMKTDNGIFLKVPMFLRYQGGQGSPMVVMDGTFWSKLINIPIDHVYGARVYDNVGPCNSGNGRKWYLLCSNSSNSNLSSADVLAGRIVPRLYMDMVFGDIRARDKWSNFDRFMSNHAVDFHTIYNYVGKGSDTGKAFREFYADIVRGG